MRKIIFLSGFILVWTLCFLPTFATEKELVAWWKFDEVKSKLVVLEGEEEEEAEEVRIYTVLDTVTGNEDLLKGNCRVVSGVSGKAIRFDGFTTSVTRKAAEAPRLGNNFTIEAWIAIGAYPWNWCPIVSQEKDEKSGYYFGIDSQGCFGLSLNVDGVWVTCKSDIRPELKAKVGPKVHLDLRKWYHLVGVYNAGRGITIYQDGKEVKSVPAKGKVKFGHELDILIGRNRRKMTPTHPVRTWATYPSGYSFDGILDEVKIYNRALTPKEIAAAFKSNQPRNKPEFKSRHFPRVPDSDRFGAYYTRLKYYEEWDALWRTAEHPDIVVQFDEHPIRVMFWRGTRYSPCWVTENGKWMADQSLETSMNWGRRWDGPTGCCEHMSDAQCRHSHVRIIESNDARVVVHWRYALIDVLYRQPHVDEITGWGDWGDEYYTIYPDGLGVRKVNYWTSGGEAGWQETIFLNEPGTKPEDNCQLAAITLVNLEGESRTYSWEHGYPKFDLKDPIIQMTNLKSKYRPFMIFRPGSRMEVFNVEVRAEYSHFPWWNHWPVAQVVSDGRHAQALDRAAHSSLVWGDPRGGAALYGMTKNSSVSLVSLAKSWIYPPELKVLGNKFISEGYDYPQRAYVINCKNASNTLEFELAASKDSPVVNPAFVIKNWGDSEANLKINGRQIKRGKDFRFGHRHTLKSSDLIVWLKTQSTKPIEITLLPIGR